MKKVIYGLLSLVLLGVCGYSVASADATVRFASREEINNQGGKQTCEPWISDVWFYVEKCDGSQVMHPTRLTLRADYGNTIQYPYTVASTNLPVGVSLRLKAVPGYSYGVYSPNPWYSSCFTLSEGETKDITAGFKAPMSIDDKSHPRRGFDPSNGQKDIYESPKCGNQDTGICKPDLSSVNNKYTSFADMVSKLTSQLDSSLCQKGYAIQSTEDSVNIYYRCRADKNDAASESATCTVQKKAGGNNGVMGDYVWSDDNKNGLQDSSEKGIGNIGMSLYECDESVWGLVLNGKGNPNMPSSYKGTFVTKTTTDANGKYLFTSLDPNKFYYVQADIPQGYAVTTQFKDGYAAHGATNSNFDMNGRSTCEKIEDAIDLGLFKNITPGVGGRVWIDTDLDGVRESGESAYQKGLKVTLHQCGSDPAGTPVAKTKTNSNGEYLFDNIAPGSYYIYFNRRGSDAKLDEYVYDDGLAYTLSNVGSNDMLDSDAPSSYDRYKTKYPSGRKPGEKIPDGPSYTYGKTDCFTVEAGSKKMGVDAGVVKYCAASSLAPNKPVHVGESIEMTCVSDFGNKYPEIPYIHVYDTKLYSHWDMHYWLTDAWNRGFIKDGLKATFSFNKPGLYRASCNILEQTDCVQILEVIDKTTCDKLTVVPTQIGSSSNGNVNKYSYDCVGTYANTGMIQIINTSTKQVLQTINGKQGSFQIVGSTVGLAAQCVINGTVTYKYDLVKQTKDILNGGINFLKLKDGGLCATVWAAAPDVTNVETVDTFMISRALNPENRIVPWCGFNVGDQGLVERDATLDEVPLWARVKNYSGCLVEFSKDQCDGNYNSNTPNPCKTIDDPLCEIPGGETSRRCIKCPTGSTYNPRTLKCEFGCTTDNDQNKSNAKCQSLDSSNPYCIMNANNGSGVCTQCGAAGTTNPPTSNFCATTLPYCKGVNTTTNKCVECNTNGDCKDPTKTVCDTGRNVCVPDGCNVNNSQSSSNALCKSKNPSMPYCIMNAKTPSGGLGVCTECGAAGDPYPGNLCTDPLKPLCNSISLTVNRCESKCSNGTKYCPISDSCIPLNSCCGGETCSDGTCRLPGSCCNGFKMCPGTNACTPITQACPNQDLECEIDPPTINKGEWLPIFWRMLETSKTEQCQSDSDVNKVIIPMAKCRLEIKKPGGEILHQVDVPCKNKGALNDTLFSSSNFTDSIGSSSSLMFNRREGEYKYLIPTDPTLTPGQYQTTILMTEKRVCRKKIYTPQGGGATRIEYLPERLAPSSIPCSFNSSVVDSYVSEKGGNNLNNLRNVSMSDFKKYDGVSLLPNQSIGSSSDISYVSSTTFNFILSTLIQSSKKIANEGYIASQNTYINKTPTGLKQPTTLLFEGDKTLELSYIQDLPRGSMIVVQNALKITDRNGKICSSKQKLIGYVIIAGDLILYDETRGRDFYKNSDLTKSWCRYGNVELAGILILPNNNTLHKKLRANPNLFLGGEDLKNSIVNEASLILQNYPSLWLILPPGANKLLNQLNVTKTSK